MDLFGPLHFIIIIRKTSFTKILPCSTTVATYIFSLIAIVRFIVTIPIDYSDVRI